MPRILRIRRPGLVHHVIARIVNGEFRIDDAARRNYLKRLDKVLPRSDWQLLGYAIMSNHVHLCTLAGEDPSSRWVQPLHTGFAGWLNWRDGRIGHVFAGRHKTRAFEDAGVMGLLAYIHNNPVRAGVVTSPDESAWSSHRAFLGRGEAPETLRTDIALRIMKCDAQAFHRVTCDRSGAPRSEIFSGAAEASVRTEARKRASAPIEIAEPMIRRHAREEYPLMRRAGVAPVVPYRGGPWRVVEIVAAVRGLDIRWLQGRERWRDVVDARRLALLVWRTLGRSVAEMAALLGLSEGAASMLLRAAATRPELHEEANALVEQLRSETRRAG